MNDINNEVYVYTVSEVAVLLKVNKNTVYKLIDDGYIQVMNLGRKKITKESLVKFLSQYCGYDFNKAMTNK